MIEDPLEMEDLADRKPEVVEKLKHEYEKWFEDVSSTRADNYAPPRIYIGTEHEDPVILTRQDWRLPDGAPWNRNQNGCWLLYAARTGNYDVCLRFRKYQPAGELTLEVGNQVLRQSVTGDQREFRFEAVNLEKGPLSLSAALNTGDNVQGPWQVEVMISQG
jgi:arylsulfatase/arylsulfatase A